MTDTNEANTMAAKPATKRPRKMAREPKTESSAQLTPDASPATRQTKADLGWAGFGVPKARPSINWSQQRAGCRTPPALR